MIDLSIGNVVAWAMQVAAIGAVGVLLPAALRITAPGARLFYLRAVLLACLVLPLVQPWVPGKAAAPVAADASSIEADQALVTGAPGGAGMAGELAGASRPSVSGRWSVELIVSGIYLTGLAVRLGWIALGFVLLARLRRTSVSFASRPSPIDAAALLVGVDADFRVSDLVVRPVTFGLRHPVVLVPPGFETFDSTQQTAIAAHELLHVGRRDWLRAVGDQLVLSVLWFHPAVWWLMEQIHLSVEQVIDRAVVQLVGERKPYLEALLKLAAAGPTPLLQPAAAFLKHGHLAERVALLVKEATMSRMRLVASFALVLAVMGAGGWYVVQAFPLTAVPVTAPAVTPPAPVVVDVPAPMPPPPAVNKDAAPPSTAGQQPPPPTRPTVDPKTQQAAPGMPAVQKSTLPPPPPPPPGMGKSAGPYDLVAWEKGVQDVQNLVTANPGRADLYLTLSVYYWERAYRDTNLSPAEKADYLGKGLQTIDRALTLKPDDVDSLVYKSLLLRLQASNETNPAKQQDLIAFADALRDKAVALRRIENPWPAIPANAVRVGGSIAPPMKLKDVKPVYPAAAQSERVQGVVIVEAVIGPDGKVQAARVLRSIALLDQAALDAVNQWEFRPTLLNGAPIPVIMTVTVNFRLDGGSTGAGAGSGTGVGVGRGSGTGVGGAVAGGVAGGVPGGVAGGTVGGVAGGVVPADNSWATSIAPDAVRIGKDIRPPTKIKDVRPIYPVEAKDAGAQGVVIIEAVIAPSGTVTAARILRSIPPLDQAALDAVNQWIFTPTLLNGTPVPVVMTVTVNFTLR